MMSDGPRVLSLYALFEAIFYFMALLYRLYITMI